MKRDLRPHSDNRVGALEQLHRRATEKRAGWGAIKRDAQSSAFAV